MISSETTHTYIHMYIYVCLYIFINNIETHDEINIEWLTQWFYVSYYMRLRIKIIKNFDNLRNYKQIHKAINVNIYLNICMPTYTRTVAGVSTHINQSKLLHFMFCKQNENINFIYIRWLFSIRIFTELRKVSHTNYMLNMYLDMYGIGRVYICLVCTYICRHIRHNFWKWFLKAYIFRILFLENQHGTRKLGYKLHQIFIVGVWKILQMYKYVVYEVVENKNLVYLLPNSSSAINPSRSPTIISIIYKVYAEKSQ